MRSPRFFVMQVVVIILATSATNTSNGPTIRSEGTTEGSEDGESAGSKEPIQSEGAAESKKHARPAKRQALGDRTNTVGVKRARPAEFVSNFHFHS